MFGASWSAFSQAHLLNTAKRLPTCCSISWTMRRSMMVISFKPSGKPGQTCRPLSREPGFVGLKGNYRFSGTEQYLFDLMDGMREHGHDVALFSSADLADAAANGSGHPASASGKFASFLTQAR